MRDASSFVQLLHRTEPEALSLSKVWRSCGSASTRTLSFYLLFSLTKHRGDSWTPRSASSNMATATRAAFAGPRCGE